MESNEAFANLMKDDFYRFARRMWRENCKERFGYGQEELSWEDYYSANEDYLTMEYYS
tara:strand:+ start:1525 stop:1698 length:174 start_codon:yes stop_codon:yes gene_type:complete